MKTHVHQDLDAVNMTVKDNNLSLFIQKAINRYDLIPAERKNTLISAGKTIQESLNKNDSADLVFICTHNSRRSIFGQVWGKIAANYFDLKKVNTFSGGTEKTEIYKEVINSFVRTGLDCTSEIGKKNPIHTIKYDGQHEVIKAFSKVYDDDQNPASFIALMTCTDADENCPFIPQATTRISLPFEDPKYADNHSNVETVYDDKSLEIATQMLFLFSVI